MNRDESLTINGMESEAPVKRRNKRTKVFHDFSTNPLNVTRINRALDMSPSAIPILEKPLELNDNTNLDQSKRQDFSEIYEKHKKLGNFPKESEVGSDYFLELNKFLKEKENSTAKTFAKVLDLGMKAAILYYAYNQSQNSGFSFSKDIINIKTFTQTFSIVSHTLVALNLMELCTARLFGLETLRHGTSIANYPGVVLRGGDPSKGGGIIGSSVGIGNQHFVETSKNYFHVMVDKYGAKSIVTDMDLNYVQKEQEALIDELVKRFCPREHAFLSGLQMISSEKQEICHLEYDEPIPHVGKLLGGFASLLFSPNINFYYHTENLPGQFVYDLDYSSDSYTSRAIKTPFPITTEHLGMRGIIGEALSNPDATIKTIVSNLKDPREVAFVVSCILGCIVFSNFAKNGLNNMLQADANKVIPEISKYVIDKKPELIDQLANIGIKCTEAVFETSEEFMNKLVLPVLLYAINVAK